LARISQKAGDQLAVRRERAVDHGLPAVRREPDASTPRDRVHALGGEQHAPPW
jgi:hypothetical protein